MAHSVSIVKRAVAGGLRVNVCDITMDTDYPAGGYVLTLASLGLANVLHYLHADFVAATPDVYVCRFIPATHALMVLDFAGGEAATGLNALDGLVVRALAVGDGPTGS